MILIKNGKVISVEKSVMADVLIDGEKIRAVGPGLEHASVEVIDAKGKLVMPGGIDPHTHLDLPMFGTVSSDDHYTGHKAAAFGGTTTVMDFVPLDKELGLIGSVNKWRHKADEKAAIDFSFHMNITHLDDQISAEIPKLLDEGITTLKVFSAYNDRLRLDDGEIYKVLRQAKELGMLVMLHAENGDIIETMVSEALSAGHTDPIWHAKTRPGWGAVEAVLRGTAIAAQAEAPLYIVHMNTGGGADMLKYAREKGILAMGETCPQYLFFTEDEYLREDSSKWVCSPPMRGKSDNERLWQALENDEIQVFSTDHCPFFYDGTKSISYEGEDIAIPGKELGDGDFTKIPNGLPGVGDRMIMLWTYGVGTGRINENQFVALTSTNAARIFGLHPDKGEIRVGADADILIWDPERELDYGIEYSHQRTDHNLYEGMKVRGFPEKVFLRGRLLVDGDDWKGARGSGKFLKRKRGVEFI
jgi:dihydropyrimidinase